MTTDRFAKDLVTGSYDLLVLNALHKRPMYGYEIVRIVATRSKQTIRWRFGTVYRVLHDLERRRLVSSQWKAAGPNRERRYYRLTTRGETVWRRQRAQWRAFSTMVNHLLEL